MKTSLSALALCTALSLSTVAAAQVPSGGAGSDAKGNAPLKHAHTVNDGGARKGRNSFTEGQARTHILKAGYQSVTGLTKGADGVWRGTAMKNGAGVPVGMDFKGNVSEGAAPMAQGATMSGATTSTTSTTARADDAPPPAAMKTTTAGTGRRHHRRHRHHRMTNRCATPSPNGAACSGVDKNRNGVSDREDRAIRAGARP